MNHACLMKLCWGIRTNGNSLWSNVLLGKYGRDFASTGMVVAKVSDLALWRNMVQLWGKMRSMEFKAIGDGESTQFWRDCWVEPGLRLEDFAVTGSAMREDVRVCDFADAGVWKWEELASCLSLNIQVKIAAILPPEEQNGADQVVWANSRD